MHAAQRWVEKMKEELRPETVSKNMLKAVWLVIKRANLWVEEREYFLQYARNFLYWIIFLTVASEFNKLAKQYNEVINHNGSRKLTL